MGRRGVRPAPASALVRACRCVDDAGGLRGWLLSGLAGAYPKLTFPVAERESYSATGRALPPSLHWPLFFPLV
jgi:hypothetical protein